MTFAKDQLRTIVERIERLEEQKKTIADDIKDVYAEAKGNGFDVKALRAVIMLRRKDAALRRKDEDKRKEEEAILDTYLNALGMLPLFAMKEARSEEHTSELQSHA